MFSLWNWWFMIYGHVGCNPKTTIYIKTTFWNKDEIKISKWRWISVLLEKSVWLRRTILTVGLIVVLTVTLSMYSILNCPLNILLWHKPWVKNKRNTSSKLLLRTDFICSSETDSLVLSLMLRAAILNIYNNKFAIVVI